jgi:ketosteroid isomerase-like protein
MTSEFAIIECAIRQLYARYVDAVWRKDTKAFADCFTEDAEWKIAGLHMRGKAAIADTIGKLLAACERVLLIPGAPLLELAHGTATGRVYCTEFAKMADGTSAMTIGIYHERYVELGDDWRFKWRHWALHYRGPTDLSAALVPCPDYGPPPNMPAPDEPTFTRRPQPSRP